MIADILFYILGALTVALAFMTVTNRDIFHSSVCLASTLICIAGIYFYLGSEFLGVVQILVYVGGIITLFIFAIKLTAKIGDKEIRQTSKQLIPAIALTIALLLVVLKYVHQYPWKAPVESASVSLKDIGFSLMSTYVLPFEFISVVLLAAMIGAIVIGKRKR